MWMFRVSYAILKFFIKKVIPFLIYAGFWCYNVYIMIYIPGAPDESYWRFAAALSVIPGIIWGMVDSATHIYSLLIG